MMVQCAESSSFARVDWNSTRNDLAALDAPLVAALDVIAARLKSEAYVYRVSYQFGEVVLDRGRFVLPASHEESGAGNVAGLDREVPLCVPLSSTFEVFHEPEKGSGALRSLRVLKPGELFGVFELLNRRFQFPADHMGNWAVAAGARSAQLVHPLGNLELRQRLWDRLGADLPDLKEYRYTKSVTLPTEFSSRLVIALARQEMPDWRAQLLIFPGQWMEDHGHASQDFERLQFEAAWRQARPSIDELLLQKQCVPLLRGDLAGLATPIGDTGAANLLSHLQAVAIGTKPAYRPHYIVPGGRAKKSIETSFGRHELFKAVLQAFYESLDGSGPTPVVMEPYHLESPGNFGWCSVSCSSLPDLFTDVATNTRLLLPLSELLREKSDLVSQILPDVDLQQSKIFCRFGRTTESQENLHHSKKIKDLCPELAEANPSTKSGFFLGCVRIVRKESR